MRIGEVIGTVTLNRVHPDLVGYRFKLAVPLSRDGLEGKGGNAVQALVVLDELGAGVGSRIAISEGAEAAAPFHPNAKAIDAYNAAILDHITIKE